MSIKNLKIPHPLLLVLLCTLSSFALSAAPGAPKVNVALTVDWGASLFELLQLEIAQQSVTGKLETQVESKLNQLDTSWRVVTDPGPQHQLRVHVSDLADSDGSLGTPLIELQLLAFGQPVWSELKPAKTRRRVTNDPQKINEFLEKDLGLALHEVSAALVQRLAEEFVAVEGGLGKKTEIIYTVSPNPGLPEYWPDRVKRVWTASRFSGVRNRPTVNDHFSDHVYIDSPGKSFAGELYPVPWASSETTTGESQSASFCLQSSDQMNPNDQGSLSGTLVCNLGAHCELASSEPAGMLQACTDQNHAGGWQWLDWFSFPKAHADVKKPVWSAASLATLVRRTRDGMPPELGYTLFELEADTSALPEADSYQLALYSNDVPVHIDGIPAEKVMFPFAREYGFAHQFPLETLNFYGGEEGCDKLTAQITFFRNGKAVAEPLELHRSYAALRDALRVNLETPQGLFSWGGRYVHPPGDEHQIFIDSGDYKFGDAAGKKKLLDWLHRQRRAFHDLGWTIPANKLGWDTNEPGVLVGVMRPPLQEVIKKPGYYGYGVTIGVTKPSGQTQMVFPKSIADEIARYVGEEAKKADRSQLSKRQQNLLKNKLEIMANPKKAYIRRNRRSDPVELLPWVCGKYET